MSGGGDIPPLPATAPAAAGRWIRGWIPDLRRRPMLGYLAALALVALGTAVRFFIADLPPFLTLFPAVLLAAFLGGRKAGLLAVAAASAAVWLVVIGPAAGWRLTPMAAIGLVGFVLVGLLIIFVIDVLDDALVQATSALERLDTERERLSLALGAADAGAWELTPAKTLFWDKTYFEMIGLDPAKVRPSGDLFAAHLHPEDRERALKEHQRAEQFGVPPAAREVHRFIRPDGRMIWLESHRFVRQREGGLHIIGVTQNITRRKETEERLLVLLREVAHRVKNQFAVILATIREVAKQSDTVPEFKDEIEARIYSMARSQDLLVEREWTGALLPDILRIQLGSFGAAERCEVSGPALMIAPTKVQYLGMAFFELATNAVKHGALSTPEGRVRVAWELVEEGGARLLRLSWRESDGPTVVPSSPGGFGRKVLEYVVPTGMGGKATLSLAPEGVVWTIEVPDPSQ